MINEFFHWQALAYEESNGWVEQFESPHFSVDGESFLLILPQEQSDKADWRHLVIVSNTTSEEPTITGLTSGKFVVTEIVSWDQKNALMWVRQKIQCTGHEKWNLFLIRFAVISNFQFHQISLRFLNSFHWFISIQILSRHHRKRLGTTAFVSFVHTGQKVGMFELQR